jgi:hypothetical protein
MFTSETLSVCFDQMLFESICMQNLVGQLLKEQRLLIQRLVFLFKKVNSLSVKLEQNHIKVLSSDNLVGPEFGVTPFK